jgi:hypothetical protein
VTPDDSWCVCVKLLDIVAREWRCRADDVAAESNRTGVRERAQMRGDDVLDVCASIQELIQLRVVVLVCVSCVLAVVGLWKEP